MIVVSRWFFIACVSWIVMLTTAAAQKTSLSASTNPANPRQVKMLPKTAPMSLTDLTPAPNASLQEKLFEYRRQIMPLVLKRGGARCGIVWAVSSINGSKTNYELLSKVGRGEGKFRLLAVLYEILSSAARVRALLASVTGSKLPEICKLEASSDKIELALFIDRDIVNHFIGLKIMEDINCTFDRVIYFDDLPAIDRDLSIVPYKRLHMLVRLAPRPNLMKLLAFLSTPYQYTLYLDGDTAACPGFVARVFDSLQDHDMLVTPNPFPYVSTNGQKVYTGSPPHRAYADFPEVNGGVMAFRWNAQTEQMIVRSLELYPPFAALGFDQDQAMMRHALFEGTRAFGLKLFHGKMAEYCRFGWKCEQNTCEAGCAIVHQRSCLGNITSVHSSIASSPALQDLNKKKNKSKTQSRSSSSSRDGHTRSAAGARLGSRSLAGGANPMMHGAAAAAPAGVDCAARAVQALTLSATYNRKNFALNRDNRRIGRVKVLDAAAAVRA